MNIVDTHVHASRFCYAPVESLLYQMNVSRVERAVLIQIEGGYDNSYFFECARRFPGRYAPVVIVEPKRDDAVQALKLLVDQGAAGIRLRVGARSPGADPLALWRACNELKLPISCNGKESEFALDEFHKVVQTVPDAPVVIEHLAFVDPDEPPPYEEFKKSADVIRIFQHLH